LIYKIRQLFACSRIGSEIDRNASLAGKTRDTFLFRVQEIVTRGVSGIWPIGAIVIVFATAALKGHAEHNDGRSSEDLEEHL
jgi:hypothetical protein